MTEIRTINQIFSVTIKIMRDTNYTNLCGLFQEGIDFAQGERFEFEEVVESVVLEGISGIVPGALCGCRGGSFNPMEEGGEVIIKQVGGVCIGTISSAADAVSDALEEP